MCSESLLTFIEFFERVLDISPEKLGATNLVNISH